ncbi:Wadjet anti-phage system protein JetA family protein [Candidatus Merdisoma sp. HCP28S3_D10]|uniref:Wadjet anti-phage system protein JetA family protein n=1 Tax=unclassified Candidatus Merdisoma TaxID=3099611 RepID=UPI003F8B125B
MQFLYEIPPEFWSLFRSGNRDVYIEALLAINDEYQYNNYFLSKEACFQILTDMCRESVSHFEREEDETEEEERSALPGRILNWLLRHKWLRRVEDYTTMTVHIVIPDYAAVLIDAFDRLVHEQIEETGVYIQNVYATLFSFKNDRRKNLSMLRTALVNTKKLNKALQDMLHNMDKFFGRLLEQKNYKNLLKEHLDGFVETAVQQKYHILKTSDNFYIYKMDIKRCLQRLREEPELTGEKEAEMLDLVDQIERGFDDIEHRIANMDREHSKYIRATVSRLNYLLSDETERHGLLVQLLNRLGAEQGQEEQEKKLAEVAERMQLTGFSVLHEQPLYRQRRRRRFEDDLTEEEKPAEMSREEILKLNQIRHRFTRKEIEDFIDARMEDGVLETSRLKLHSEEDFEKLILAYDLAVRRNSPYRVMVQEEQLEENGYRYPKMAFFPRNQEKAEQEKED